MTTGVSALTRLKDRAALGWLRERDIDLLVCSEVHVEGPLRDHLAMLWPGRRVTFGGAWVSHAEIGGESDLVVVFHDDGQALVLLIENKISAGFQPEQVERYNIRADRWREDMGAEVRTVLLAPEDYIQGAVDQPFDATLSYEALAEALKAGSDPRSAFLAVALAAGMAAYRRGYTSVPNEAVTDVWTAVWRLAVEETPLLKMERPQLKPGRSSFIYFMGAVGFELTRWRDAVVVLKAAHGHADLQFGGTTAADLERSVGAALDRDMIVAKAAKSAAIRLQVPVVDFERDPSEQVDAIGSGLLAAERLRAFHCAHQPLALLQDQAQPT